LSLAVAGNRENETANKNQLMSALQSHGSNSDAKLYSRGSSLKP
jgi:hypothetical protein